MAIGQHSQKLWAKNWTFETVAGGEAVSDHMHSVAACWEIAATATQPEVVGKPAWPTCVAGLRTIAGVL